MGKGMVVFPWKTKRVEQNCRKTGGWEAACGAVLGYSCDQGRPAGVEMKEKLKMGS